MIPPEGRDVQCSNCSTTWYQPGRRVDPAPETEFWGTQMPPNPAPAAAPAAPSETERDPDPGPNPAANPDPDPKPDGDQPPPPMPERRELEPAVRDILRQEADREARLRQAEADPVETQAEMPLVEDRDGGAPPRCRAKLDASVDDLAAGDEAPERPVAARDLFPDIEQINSTLRDTGDRSGADADASDIDTLDTAPRRRRGVRLGFVLAMALAAAGAGLYGNADLVGVTVPALAPILDVFVETVNAARFWLDDMAQRLAGATDA